MICHKNKCIFIHISKCAGSSVEKSFGINVYDNSPGNNKNLFGWSDKHKLYLQHATPQQLFDFELISRENWETYYKFIIIRNPWSRAVSDYFWISKTMNVKDSFTYFILRKGSYSKILNNKSKISYRGDHLNCQKEYFFIDGSKIEYDAVLRFEDLNEDVKKLKINESIKNQILSKKLNSSKSLFNHYSHFYNYNRKGLISKQYRKDIEFFKYNFDNKKDIKKAIKSQLPSIYFLNKIQ